jgi:hypothetical protein
MFSVCFLVFTRARARVRVPRVPRASRPRAAAPARGARRRRRGRRPASAGARPRSVRRPAWPPAGPSAVCLRGSRGHGSATPGHRASALPRGTSHGRDLPSHTLYVIAVRVPPRVRVARPVRARTGASGHQRHRQSPLVLGRVRSSPASSSRRGEPPLRAT